MIKLFVQYQTPSDIPAYNRHYDEVHVPLVLKMPKLALFEYSHGDVFLNGEKSDIYLIATLGFNSMEDMQYSMGSEEGQKALADLQELTDAPVNTYMIDTDKGSLIV